MKKIFALLLSVVMLAGMFPPAVFAAGEKTGEKTYRTGDIISFGSYPQSRVTDKALIAALDKEPKEWKSYGYYSGTGKVDGKMQPGDWMRYADFLYNDVKYRAVTFDVYRPREIYMDVSDVDYLQNDRNYFQDDNGYITKETYYFRYEPIKWRVLDPSKSLVFSEKIIDSQAYQNEIYYNIKQSASYYQGIDSNIFANSYATSSIRNWLTGEFYHTAFSEAQQSYIALTPIENHAANIYSDSWRYNSKDTTDSIFSLSYEDVLNADYGFGQFSNVPNSARIAKGTDYAKCQGLFASEDGCSNWWLRSPGGGSLFACRIDYDDYFESIANVYWSYNGVRPAFCFQYGIIDESTQGEIKFPYLSDYYAVVGSDKVYRPKEKGAFELSAAVRLEDDVKTLSAEDVIWTSSDPSVFSVSGGGISQTADNEWMIQADIAAKKPGSVTVTATIGETSSSVTVHVVDYTIALSHEGYAVYVGGEKLLDGDVESPADLVAYIKGKTGVLLEDSVWWESSDPAVFEVRRSSFTKDMQPNAWIAKCDFKAHKPGKVTLTLFISGVAKASAEVEVKNDLGVSVTYDKTHYFADNCFLGENHGVSDSVDFYLLFSNYNKGEDENKTDAEAEPIKPITVTAEVDKDVFSFSRDTTVTRFRRTYDEIPLGTAIDDLLTLYVKDGIKLPASERTFQLKLTLESESLAEPMEESFSFTLKPLEQKNADDHILFFNSNSVYRTSKLNCYSNMSELKHTKKYYMETFLDIEFTNYYDVVLTDLMLTMLQPDKDATEEENNGFLAELVSEVKTLKSWKSTYNSVLGKMKEAADFDYKGHFAPPTESDLDNLLKKSRYVTEPNKVTDKFRDEMVLFFGNESAGDINNMFAAIDKSKQIVGLIKTGKNILAELNAFVDRVMLYDSYVQADDALKDVMQMLGMALPAGSLMQESVYDYVNSAVDTGGFMSEFFESLTRLEINVGSSVFKFMIGQSYFDFAKCRFANWLGSKKLFGSKVPLAESAIGAQILGSVVGGYGLGKLASDLLCSSSDEKRETAKLIAMAEYSDYILQTLEYYEQQVRTQKNDEAVSRYEYAFALHKACQCYLMDHTVRALEIERDCPVIKFLKWGFDYDKGYDAAIAKVLAEKKTLEQLQCHSAENDALPGVRATVKKVVKIKCPVDVRIKDAAGNEIVRIVNNQTELAAAGAEVLITPEDAKYILLPSDGAFTVALTAFDAGTMEYGVLEVPSDGAVREVTFADIPLVADRTFTGDAPEGIRNAAARYALSYENSTTVDARDLTYAADGSGGIAETGPLLSPGDVDGNGKITSADARLALRASVGLEKEIVKGTAAYSAADADGNGTVSSGDARLILRASVGLEDPAKWRK